MAAAAVAQGQLEIERVPCLSDNYSWLLHEPQQGVTAVVDPAEVAPVVAALEAKGWKLTHILNSERLLPPAPHHPSAILDTVKQAAVCLALLGSWKHSLPAPLPSCLHDGSRAHRRVPRLRSLCLAHTEAHHHWDHVGGNEELKKRYGVTVVGPRADAARIPGIDVQLGDGDRCASMPTPTLFQFAGLRSQLAALGCCLPAEGGLVQQVLPAGRPWSLAAFSVSKLPGRLAELGVQQMGCDSPSCPQAPGPARCRYQLGAAEFECFDTPGHTRGHVTYHFPASKALFPGAQCCLQLFAQHSTAQCSRHVQNQAAHSSLTLGGGGGSGRGTACRV